MKKNIITITGFLLVVLLCSSCTRDLSCHQEMIDLLEQVRQKTSVAENIFSPAPKLIYMDSMLALPNNTPEQIMYCNYLKANILMELGREDEAITLYEKVLPSIKDSQSKRITRDLAIAYLRKGERDNCIFDHAAESCIIPLRGLGLHRNKTGSTKAIDLYLQLLERDPKDIESRWLLNIAYMTLGSYPDQVPPAYLIADMEGDRTVEVQPFEDIAGGLKLDVKNMAGGSIVEDFDNDGYLDIITSSLELTDQLHYFKNNGNGTFTDVSEQSGLKNIRGGLNMIHADYNNDGYKDILILRGAWKGKYGNEPNSLLRNNGDGTFTDVTTISGILSFHPTQTATWNDFNNDGFLDVFIGNETSDPFELHPSELYLNNGDGTFRNIASISNSDYSMFIKGVTSGDYNNDGWQDIFISTMNGQRMLLKNNGLDGGEISFQNVTSQAGLDDDLGNSFVTWFWDYDNDGWLDIFVCDYSFRESMAYYAAAEKLDILAGNKNKMLLYRNNRDGTFTNMANELGLNKMVFAMGANFGDIDNDGFLDMYLGTGNPQYQSLIPNKMFKNIGGERFEDVTASARVGHLQKGHGVSFADLDNDGDQDIYIQLGGAYPGDAYQNSLFMNPGQSNNNWIYISLEGVASNRDAIGSRIKVSFTENGIARSVYRDVNSGGSFGGSPLRREIGIGKATKIDHIEIQWGGSNTTQRVTDIQPNQLIKITEGSGLVKSAALGKIDWILFNELCYPDIFATSL
ncbi:tetratricopeptide (TPR) repeat protein [Algoriphagus sp. 4150]|uniref:FG-GAP-like repeat-containing protein n=1 Tax=Algoriphagus sp. 4150 TaxID=2817756 RepID=UPI002860A18E|nr:FG-GAP-like repeat-containing protein [Algoriphagus sp. 4150]MDR7131141.1 tetratricopeptide (TPR) repeat protein [Algoriphagus sp. 4150]